MIWAYFQSHENITNHGEYFGLFSMLINTDLTITYGDINPNEQKKVFSCHGWLMWLAWGFFGFIQIASNRWLKPFYKLNMWMHRICGTAILILTLVMSFIAIKEINWWIITDVIHTCVGLIILGLVLIIVVWGVMTRYMQVNLKWQTNKILWLKFSH